MTANNELKLPRLVSNDYSKTVQEELRELKRYITELSPRHIPRFKDIPVHNFASEIYPLSYRTNTNVEEQCLEHIKVFKSQYKHVFKTRKKLLLTPRNECGVKKFICTYICPVKWPFMEMLEWSGIASFVSDHLNFLHLMPTTEVPKQLFSSTTILKLQEGNSYDYALLMCSLLLGVGYDAYVVSGYAVRECCYNDQTRTVCPMFKKEPDVLPQIKRKPDQKYMVKPIKSLQSRYDLLKIAKGLNETKIAENKLVEEEERRQLELEKPPPDALFGLRVHAWVLIKAGQRDITEDFFIEPFTGVSWDVHSNIFLGIESVFNDKNYWINKQNCADGLKKIKYNLNNLKHWEAIVYEKDFFADLITKQNEDEDEAAVNDEKVFDIPTSWVKNLTMDNVTFEMRYFKYRKLIKYYKVKQYMYSPHYCLSGLVMRVKVYEDMKYKNKKETIEFLNKRQDMHYKTVMKNGEVTQYFYEGNEFRLKEYNFEEQNPGPETNKVIEFYENARVDGLVKRIETPLSIEEHYKNRDDLLEKLYVTFVPRDKDDNFVESYRFIERIYKTYRRNKKIPATEDIKEIKYSLNENEIFIVYHIGDHSLFSTTRRFIKPTPTTDGRNAIVMEKDTYEGFLSDPNAKEKTNLEIYNLLKYLMVDERKTISLIRYSEQNTKSIIKARQRAIREDILYLDMFDTIRNQEATKQRKMIEAEYKISMTKTEEMLDFLIPFMAKLNISEVTTKEQAFMIREACLNDFKKRLIKQANLIKDRYNIETDKLQKKQTWYYQNKLILSLEEDKKYIVYCQSAISLLDTLQNLLSRHKQTAPHRYMHMERKIRSDPRIEPFIN